MALTVFENYKLKLVALIFAVLIWFMVVTENDYDHVIEIPITAVNVHKSKVILNEFPRKANVRITGSGKSLIALGVSRGARLELDMLGVENRKTFHLEPRNVILPRPAGTINPVEILMPDSVTIILDDFTTKRIPVKSKVKLVPAPGYIAVGDVQISPDSVIVSGPKSIVENIEDVFTLDEEYSELTFDFEKAFSLAPLPYQRVALNKSVVEVFQNIQKLVEVTLNGVPVEVRNPPGNMKVNVRPSTLSLVLKGGGDLLTQLNRNDIIAYIDYNRVRSLPGNEFPAAIEKPDGVEYKNVKPPTFKLVLERLN